jgi:hypothetical protein
LVPNIDYNALREDGDKNLDMSVKGKLYPVDIVFNSHPNFKTITGLCQFVSHGNSDLIMLKLGR